jgi:O-methyltransferase
MTTKIIGKLLDILGYDHQISKKSAYVKKASNDFQYSQIKTTSSYSPWLGDRPFLDIYGAVWSSTLVDIYRCYEIWSLVEEASKLPGKAAFLEVGVWRGGTSAIIAKKLKTLGSDELLYAADTFTGVVKSTKKDSSYSDGEHKDTNIETVKEMLQANLRLDNIRILQGIFPEDTQQLIPEGTRFRFCHIDVDVYKSSEDIVNWIWDRLLPGGIILFDDYGFITCDGITQFVNEQRKLKDRLFIYNLNGHAILVKLR